MTYELPNFGSTPASFYCPGMTSYKGNLIVWGGYSNTEIYDQTLYIYYLTNYTWSSYSFDTPMPRGRHSNFLAVYSDYLYVFPGSNHLVETEIRDMWRINLIKLEAWEEVEINNTKHLNLRGKAASLQIDSFVYQISGSGFTNDVILIDLSLEVKELKELSPNFIYPTARKNFVMMYLNSNLILFGGEGNDGKL